MSEEIRKAIVQKALSTLEDVTIILGTDRVREYIDSLDNRDDKKYCPNAPLKPGEMCFCGKPVRPIMDDVTRAENKYEAVAGVLMEFVEEHPLSGRGWTVKEFVDGWLIPKGSTGMCMCPYCLGEKEVPDANP